MGIFLDTGFFVGLCHPDDDHHFESNKILNEMSSGEYGLIYTSPFIISEAATLLLIRTKNNQKLLAEFYDTLYGNKKFAKILPWTLQLEEMSWELFKEINKKAKLGKDYLSFVDCTNIAYCRSYEITHIASYDTHFDGFFIRVQ